MHAVFRYAGWQKGYCGCCGIKKEGERPKHQCPVFTFNIAYGRILSIRPMRFLHFSKCIFVIRR